MQPVGFLRPEGDLPLAIALSGDAASKLHGAPGIFQKAGQFPVGEEIDLPLSDSARQFYKSGPPFQQRYLPFWTTVFVGQ